MRYSLMPVLLVHALLLAQPPIKEEIRIDSHVGIPMRDGVKLYADIYRPNRPGKFPVLVVRTPYGVQRDGVHAEALSFARAGFIVVNQDVRGRYESEGKWEPFRDEAKDGHDTIAWAAKQEWSTGKVGSQGGSYLGNNQWLAAALQPPGLTVMTPRVASTSIYHNWAYFGGAFRLSFNYGWGVVRMPHRIMQPQYWHTEAFSPAELSYDRILWHTPLETGDLASSNTVVPHYRDWVKHESYDDYWRALSVEERFSDIKQPALMMGGWFDIFLAGTLNGYTGMRQKGGSETARRESKLIVGPWGHGPTQKFGDVDFGPTARKDWNEIEQRWYGHYLRGDDNGMDREPPVEIFYMGANKWKKESDWPIPGTKYTPLYLSSDGRPANSVRGGGQLAWEKPSAGKNSYRYDPANPVMTLGGNNCCGTPTLAGPKDQRPLESRGDVLVYTGPILDKPVAIAGPVKMVLHASTDGPDTDWMVKLVDVHPDGFAMPVAEGILRARFREGLDRPKLLQANQTYEFSVDMAGTANVFLPGHRLRVDITSSNFPQFDRNPNTGEPLGKATQVRVANNTILHGGPTPSHILLPVVPHP